MRKFFTIILFVFMLWQNSYSQCATLSAGTVLPSGPFTCGDAFTLCVTVTSYTQTDFNYLFAADLAGLPAGSTVSPGTPAPNGLMQGVWDWNSAFQGWEFDDSAFGFGVDCTTCNITFCYDVTLPAAPCSFSTFNPTISVYGDFTSACDDPAVTPSGWANQVLPIELKAIKAHNIGNQNHITWTTASESNNEVQMVERSMDGKSGWEMIGKVAGTNKTEEVTYEVIDENPLTTSYYRVHSIDYDGRKQVSKIVMVRRSGKGEGKVLSIHPNPTRNFAEIDLDAVSEDNLQITLSDMTGKVFSSSQYNVSEGINTLQIPMENIPSGLYLISAQGAGIQHHSKIVKE